MPRLTFTSVADTAKTKKSENCSFGREHYYDFLFLHLIAQGDSYKVLRCRNCAEIIKERVVETEENELLMN